MYKFTIEGTTYSLPKENIMLFAYDLMKRKGDYYNVFSEKGAIEYLSMKGVQIVEVK